MKINLVSNEKFSVTKPNKGEVFVPDRETDSTLAVVEDIATAFSSADTYEVGEYVSYDGGLYKCVSAVSASGEWDPDYWTAFTVMNEANSSEQLQADWDQTDDSSPDFIKNKPTIHTDRIVSPSGNLEVVANNNGTATISTSGLGNATAFFPAGFSIWLNDDTYSTDVATAIEFVGPYSTEHGTYWVPSDIENPESFNPEDYSTWCLYAQGQGATSPYALMFETGPAYMIVSGWESSTQSLELGYGETSGGFPTMNRGMVSVPKIIATVDQTTLVPVFSQTPTYSEWVFHDGVLEATCEEYSLDPTLYHFEMSNEPMSPGSDIFEFALKDSSGEQWGSPIGGARPSSDGLSMLLLSAPSFVTDIVQSGDAIATRERTDMIGYQLGSQSDKLLAPNSHIYDTIVHITSAERNYWNNKANSTQLRYSFHPVTASFSGTSASADVMDRSINSFEIASGVDNLSITIPALAYNGKARDFICNINVVDEAGPENVVFGTNQTIDLGSDVLTGMEQGQNVLLFTEISQDHWMISRYGSGGGDKANAASLAAPYESDHSSAYVVGDYVTHEGTLYKCKSDTSNPPGEWDDNNWDAVAVTDEMGGGGDKANSSSIAPVFSTSDSYSAGDHVTKDGDLYVCLDTTSGSWDSTKWKSISIYANLPYDAELEYIELGNGCWIDPLVNGNLVNGFSHTIKLTDGFVQSAGKYAICGAQQYDIILGIVHLNNDAGLSSLSWGDYTMGGRYKTADGSNFTNTFSSFGVESGYVILNGESLGSIITGTNGDNRPYLIGKAGGTSYAFTASVPKVQFGPSKIFVDGVLVRDFIPVRKNGVGYYYDKISGALFGKASGSADIGLGPDKSGTLPLMDGTAAHGTSTEMSPIDHVHPTDTSLVSKSGDTMTGPLTINDTLTVTGDINSNGNLAVDGYVFATQSISAIGEGVISEGYRSFGADYRVDIKPEGVVTLTPLQYIYSSPSGIAGSDIGAVTVQYDAGDPYAGDRGGVLIRITSNDEKLVEAGMFKVDATAKLEIFYYRFNSSSFSWEELLFEDMIVITSTDGYFRSKNISQAVIGHDYADFSFANTWAYYSYSNNGGKFEMDGYDSIYKITIGYSEWERIINPIAKTFATIDQIPPRITVDSTLSSISTNPVQNKVIYETIGDINSVLDAINGEVI